VDGGPCIAFCDSGRYLHTESGCPSFDKLIGEAFYAVRDDAVTVVCRFDRRHQPRCPFYGRWQIIDIDDNDLELATASGVHLRLGRIPGLPEQCTVD